MKPAAATYDLYLRGRFYWNQRSESSLKQAIDYFRRAIVEAPDYAPAYAAIADCYAQFVYGCYMAPTEGFTQARAALKRARLLDPASPEMLASEGYLDMYFDWDFNAAHYKFEQAIAANPNYAAAYDWMGVLFTAKEKRDSGRAALERARRLDPGSLPIATDLGFNLHYSGRNKQAEETLRNRTSVRDRSYLSSSNPGQEILTSPTFCSLSERTRRRTATRSKGTPVEAGLRIRRAISAHFKLSAAAANNSNESSRIRSGAGSPANRWRGLARCAASDLA